MSLSDVGVPGQMIDVLRGGDVDPTGRLLSVAELQHAFRELRSRPPTAPAPVAASDPDLTPQCRTDHEVTTVPDVRGDDLHADWVAVLAAHAGAGASTVALAVADALAAAGRATRLIETADPTRSGLVAAATAEMGVDSSGAWRRGTRATGTIYRRSGEAKPSGWPEPDGVAVQTVVDLGLPALAGLDRLVATGPHLILVCRVSVPGIRAAEHVLRALHPLPVVVAAIGAARWPGEVEHSLGPLLGELRSDGRVVNVALDRMLQVNGPTHAELPRAVASAGTELLRLIELTPNGESNPSAPTSTWTRIRKGKTR